MSRPGLIAGTLTLGWALALAAVPPEPTLKPPVRAIDLNVGESQQVELADGKVPLANDGYARTVHRYAKAGHYLVRVERAEPNGDVAVAHVHVRVGPE